MELSNRRLAGENAKLQRSVETAEEGSLHLGEEILALRKQLRRWARPRPPSCTPPCPTCPQAQAHCHFLSILGRNWVSVPHTQSLSLLFPLGLCLGFLCCSEWIYICDLCLPLSHVAHLPLPPLSSQQALQFAKALDEELEDLKTLAKSLEEQNRGLLAQARQTVGFWQGAQRCTLLPTILESEQQRLTMEWERAEVSRASSLSPGPAPQTLDPDLLAIPLMTKGTAAVSRAPQTHSPSPALQ